MADNSKHINYSATDIEKYWRGELSPAAMHAMEKSALEDPFLTEAMEGYGKQVTGYRLPVADDIADLERRLQDRVSSSHKKTVPIAGWWKIAAAVIVIAGGSAIAWLLTNKPVHQNLAKNEIKEIPKQQEVLPSSAQAEGHPRVAAAPADSSNKHTITLVEKEKAAKERRAVPASSLMIKPAPAVTLRRDNTFAQNDEHPDAVKGLVASAATRQKALSAIVQNKTAPKDSGLLPGENTNIAALNERVPPAKTLNGTVVDPLNRPVANATVRIAGINSGTLTDDKGYFAISAPDTTGHLSVAAVGYKPVNFQVHNDANSVVNRVVLEPENQALNEVVVVGYGSRKKQRLHKSRDISVSVLQAEPSVGWDAYNGYIEKNKQVPDELQSVHGDVVVGFDVSSKGLLKNIKIEKSLESRLDEEAIRLIRHGPSWHLLSGRKTRVTVMVKF